MNQETHNDEVPGNDMEQKMYRINEQLNLIYTQKEERSLRSREIQESFSVLYHRVSWNLWSFEF